MRLHRLLRNRAIGLARRALAPAATWRDARTPSTLPLADVQRRLELLLAAMFGRPLRIGAETPASSDGRRTTADIVLPPRLAAPDGLDTARERYRLLAIERAMRIVRGSDAVVPSGDRLERDLYLLAEGVSIDRDIVERAPGLAGAVSRLRLAELSARLPVQRVPIAERAMESLLQSALAEEVRREDGSAPRTSSPEDSLAWARARRAPSHRITGICPLRGSAAGRVVGRPHGTRHSARGWAAAFDLRRSTNRFGHERVARGPADRVGRGG